MPDKIKKCPFCGGIASIKHKRYKGTLHRCDGFGYWGNKDKVKILWWVGCFNKGCSIKPSAYGDKDEAIKNWNNRADTLEGDFKTSTNTKSFQCPGEVVGVTLKTF